MSQYKTKTWEDDDPEGLCRGPEASYEVWTENDAFLIIQPNEGAASVSVERHTNLHLITIVRRGKSGYVNVTVHDDGRVTVDQNLRE